MYCFFFRYPYRDRNLQDNVLYTPVSWEQERELHLIARLTDLIFITPVSAPVASPPDPILILGLCVCVSVCVPFQKLNLL